MNTQHQFWAGEGGDAYTDRNFVSWPQRMPFWTRILQLTGARSVLEVGCNAGWNLLALRTIHPWVLLAGTEINETAANRARALGLSVGDIPATDTGTALPYTYDMVFTVGVLIHISQQDIPGAMKEIVAVSKRYVLSVEYEADPEVHVVYRGETELLWKRPYTKMYQEMGLKLCASGFLSPVDGFDNCHWALLEKP